jgi:hypothetical protein
MMSNFCPPKTTRLQSCDMYYILKYISKPEEATHSKLIIAAAVHKDLSQESFNNTEVDLVKKILHKTYNKLLAHRKAGTPEAISHLLHLPEQLADAMFATLHTTHLLRYINRDHQRLEPLNNNDDAELDSQIIQAPISGYSLVSIFDDYAH